MHTGRTRCFLDLDRGRVEKRCADHFQEVDQKKKVPVFVCVRVSVADSGCFGVRRLCARPCVFLCVCLLVQKSGVRGEVRNVGPVFSVDRVFRRGCFVVGSSLCVMLS